MCLQHPEDVVKQFLSAEEHAKAPNQTLNEDDWSHQKAVIFLKSVFLNSTVGGSFAPKMEEVHNFMLTHKCNIHLNDLYWYNFSSYCMHSDFASVGIPTQVAKDNIIFVFKAAQSHKISESAVKKFLSATVILLQQMLKSESPIIPWTGLKIYNPLFVEVDARQLACQTDDPMDGDYFKGWKICGYKHPILLSCNHCKVKIVKGKVRLEEPK